MEALEERLALDGRAAIPTAETNLTLSFAPDGVDIAGEPNVLSEKFDALAPTKEWQTHVAKAFQTWAVNTDADIGLIDDSGLAFGMSEIGDIRIGARPLGSNVAAVSIPITGVLGGGWLGDVIFNSEYDFQTIDDLFAVALHEAGNVFGLQDNDNPESPLHGFGVPASITPTEDDISALQQMYGSRSPDWNENNDTFNRAEQLRLVRYQGEFGAAPSIVYGDIQNGTDHDYFSIEPPRSYTGGITVQLRTAGLSALAGRVDLYSVDGRSLATAQGDILEDTHVTLTVDATNEDEFFVRVSSDSGDVWNVGGYALVVSFDEINRFSPEDVDWITDGTYRKFDEYDLQQLIGGDDRFARDHDHDDRFDSSVELELRAHGKYELVASLDTADDVDMYRIDDGRHSNQDVITITVRPLDSEQLTPTIEVFDKRQGLLPTNLLANHDGTVVIQVANTDHPYVKVRSSENSSFVTGNYELEVALSDSFVTLDSVSELVFGGNHAEQKLYIAKPQLFHLLGTADGSTEDPAIVQTRIASEDGTSLYDLITPVGQSRSNDGILLMPGEYTVTYDLLTPSGEPPTDPVRFSLAGTALSDPLAIDLVDPIDRPFDCGSLVEGEFCYPDGTTSTDPFVWGNSATSTVAPTEPDAQTLGDWRDSDWWDWYWSPGEKGNAPVASPDSYVLHGMSELRVSAEEGLLSNDADPEDDDIVALLVGEPDYGAVEVSIDGSFVYTPPIDFVGEDVFTYQASDFGGFSDVQTVTIDVLLPGDLDQDHDVDGDDIDTMAAAIRDGALEPQFDVDANGTVDRGDFDFLITSVIGTLLGDANVDFRVDASDYDAWDSHRFATDTGWSQGDFNGDGVTDGADLNVWYANRTIVAGTAVPDSTAPESAVPNSTTSDSAAFDLPTSEPSPTEEVHDSTESTSVFTGAREETRYGARFKPSIKRGLRMRRQVRTEGDLGRSLLRLGRPTSERTSSDGTTNHDNPSGE